VEEQPSVFRDALSTARNVKRFELIFGRASARAEALAAIAERLPAEQRADVLGEALSVAQSIGDTSARAGALAAIAERLATEQRASVLARR
jgi:hypothetical protein